MILSRRKLLQFLGVGILAAGGAVGATLYRGGFLLRRVPDRFYSAEIGRRLIAGGLVRADRQALASSLNAKLPFYAMLAPAGLDGELEAAITRDFLNSDVVELNGWIIPETTAFLSALAHMENDDVH